jgi:hypothetical protein
MRKLKMTIQEINNAIASASRESGRFDQVSVGRWARADLGPLMGALMKGDCTVKKIQIKNAISMS